MKKIWKQVISVSVCLVVVIGALLGVYFTVGKENNNNNYNSDNNTNNESTIEKVETYGGMVYYASETEETGAVLAPNELKGGAIYVGNGSTFELDGGSLYDHEGKYGGAVYVANGGTFTMTGGTIEYNYSMYGGAIYVEKGGKCFINGGEITNNKGENAPAIYVEDGGQLKIAEAAAVHNNGFIEYTDVEINFYVDGSIVKTVNQMSAAFKMKDMPLTYEECNGYFLDETMIYAVEQGDDLSLVKNKLRDESIVADSSGFKDVYNLYTKTATPDNCEFVLKDNYYSVKNYGTVGDAAFGTLVVPKQYNGLNVESFEESGFVESKLSNVYIPSTIKSIANNVFQNSQHIENINIPNSVTEIGEYSFSGLKALKNVIIPCSMTNIATYAFLSSGIENLICAGNNLTIGKFAFESNKSMTNVSFHGSISSIGDYAFRYLNSITNITIPACVSSVGYQAFSNSDTLQSVTIEDGVKELTGGAFRYCPNINLINFNATNITTAWPFYDSGTNVDSLQQFINFGENVTEIPNELFWGFKARFSISEIPSNITKIGEKAFMESYLQLIEIPSSVKTIASTAFKSTICLQHLSIIGDSLVIPDELFKDCTSLNSVDITGTSVTIGASAFENCIRLCSVNLSGVEVVGNNSFKGCGLTSIDFPISIHSLGASAFEGLSLSEISLSYSINFIGDSCFKNCTSLKKVSGYIYGEIGQSVFEGCTSLTDVTLLGSNTYLNANLFKDCTSLLRVQINNPLAVAYIDNTVFTGCSSIEELDIAGDNNLTIPTNLLSERESLKKLTLRDGVVEISHSAFIKCSNLETIDIGSDVTRIGDGAFRYSTGLKEIIYRATNCTYAGWPFYDSGTAGVEIDLTIGTNVKRIPKQLFWIKNGIKSVEIPDGVEVVEEQAFYDCKELTSLSIGNVQTLEKNAFYNCSAVNSIYYNAASASNMEAYTSPFNNSGNNANVIIGKDVQIVPQFMFTYVGGTYLSMLSFEEGSVCTLIDTSAFENATISSINFENATQLDKLNGGSFKNNGSLRTVTFSDNLRAIGYGAFDNCKNLSTVNFNEKLVDIQARAFYGCSSLSEISLPSNLKCIRAWAFQGTNISEVVIPASVIYVGKMSFLTLAYSSPVGGSTVGSVSIIFENTTGWYLAEDSQGNLGDVQYTGSAASLINSDGYVDVSSSYVIGLAACTDFIDYHLLQKPLTEEDLLPVV